MKNINVHILNNSYILNLVSGLLCQFLTAISGLILPNLILNTYGSVLNGLISTTTQLIAYLSLVEMGLSSASLVALYKPMAEKDYDRASSIFASINLFYRKVSLFFCVGAIGIGFIIPFILKDEIPLYTILLVVLSLVGINLTSYLLLNKYKALLQADDKIYVINFVHVVGIIIQFVLSVILIKAACNISLVKGIIIFTNIIEWLLLYEYCRRKFPKITLYAKPAHDSIKQRNDIIVHQVLSLILNNTDVVLLTVFSSSLAYVSVYSIYAMIALLLQNIANCIISMFASKQGQMYTIGDYEMVRSILNKYEAIYDIFLFCIYSCMDLLIMPFVSLYTKGISDANYYVPLVGLLFSVYGISRMLRLPYTELTNAAGRFKETKIQAILEAAINLAISILLVPKYGIPGVLVGSIAGEVYRTIHSYVYCYNHVLKFDYHRSIILGMINTNMFVLLHYSFAFIRKSIICGYIELFVKAFIIFVVILTLYIFVNLTVLKAYKSLKKFLGVK